MQTHTPNTDHIVTTTIFTVFQCQPPALDRGAGNRKDGLSFRHCWVLHTTGTPAERVCKEHSKQQQEGLCQEILLVVSHKELVVKAVLAAGKGVEGAFWMPVIYFFIQARFSVKIFFLHSQ